MLSCQVSDWIKALIWIDSLVLSSISWNKLIGPSEHKSINWRMRNIGVFLWLFALNLFFLLSLWGFLFRLLIGELNFLDFSTVKAFVPFILSKIQQLLESLTLSHRRRYASATSSHDKRKSSVCSNKFADSFWKWVVLWVIFWVLWDIQNVIEVYIILIELLCVNQSIDHVFNTWKSPHFRRFTIF